MAAFSVSYLGAALIGLAVLHRRAGGLGGVAPGIARQGTAAIAAGVVLVAFSSVVDVSGRMGSLLEALGGVILGLGVYVVVLLALRGDDLALLRSLRSREPTTQAT